jgi:molecular chaperone HtpG
MSTNPTIDESVERFEMRTNFDGLVQLLARNLYPEPDVFLRELIQNAHDGIVRRARTDPDASPRIDIDIDREARTLSVRDEGIGMDRDDIREFLSVIGSTGTGATRRQLETVDPQTAHRLIGQFGVGALAAFVVADRVTVHTRRADAAIGWRWENTGTNECTLRPCARDQPGTTVSVHLATEYGYMLDAAWIRRTIVRYCDFLAFPIHVGGVGPVNAVDAPWHRAEWMDPESRPASCRTYVKRRFQIEPLEVIPIAIDAPIRVSGILFLADAHVPEARSRGVDVYVRRVFIRGRDTELLPAWARFVSGVIDTPDLTPTAARDNVRRDDAACRTLIEVLGRVLLQALERTARESPDRFRRICASHQEHLSAIAATHARLFHAVRDLLVFETNRGLRCLPECIAPADAPGSPPPTLYYFPADADARQYFTLADAAGVVAVSAVHTFDEDLLVRYVQSHDRGIRLVRLDTARDTLFFRDPGRHRSCCTRLERATAAALRRTGFSNVSVSIRNFDPADVPAIVLMGADAAAELRLSQLINQPWFIESLHALTREMLDEHQSRGLRFVLNEKHALVQRLLDDERDPRQMRDVLCALFLAACLPAPDVLGVDVAKELQPSLVRLLLEAVGQSASPFRLVEEGRHAAAS